MMQEKITLDMLTQNSVSVKRQQYIQQNKQQYEVGEPWRKAFVNSKSGRQQIENEVSEPYKSAIFMMWGDSPTVFEDEQ